MKLNAGHLGVLWEELLASSPVENDRKQIYQWLREVCDSIARARNDRGSTVITTEELIQFYQKSLAVEREVEDEYKLLSIEGFHCIQSFFVLINELEGKLTRVSSDSGVYQAGAVGQEAAGGVGQQVAKKFTSYNSITGAEYTSYSFNQPGTQSQGTQAAQPTIGP